MGAIIMDGAQIGSDCIVAAGSLVVEKMVVPDGSVVMGTPARVVRSLRDADQQWILKSSKNYCELAKTYLLTL
jgi:carbonic anhydrase/acetyltransferase-like protein (isoleucine patch superfamily)